VISGRRLDHAERILPVPRLLLAGTYGIELKLPNGERIDRVSYDQIRPLLEEIKARWTQLLSHRTRFFLEDKGWALAIHGRYATDDEAEETLVRARAMIGDAAFSDLFRLLGGDKFLELGPALAHKGTAVAYLLDRYPWSDALPLYVGDDDKDEEAFGVVQAREGIAIRVCAESCETQADGRLESPEEVRQWLSMVAA
jgi:trehalose-phosphatase